MPQSMEFPVLTRSRRVSPEILDMLIAYRWQDLFGPFTKPPAEVQG